MFEKLKIKIETPGSPFTPVTNIDAALNWDSVELCYTEPSSPQRVRVHFCSGYEVSIEGTLESVAAKLERRSA